MSPWAQGRRFQGRFGSREEDISLTKTSIVKNNIMKGRADRRVGREKSLKHGFFGVEKIPEMYGFVVGSLIGLFFFFLIHCITVIHFDSKSWTHSQENVVLIWWFPVMIAI